jgi:hypothetical protein
VADAASDSRLHAELKRLVPEFTTEAAAHPEEAGTSRPAPAPTAKS